MGAEQGQLQQFIEKAAGVPPPEQRDPRAAGSLPLVPFGSSLVLNLEQETALVDHGLRRLQELEAELGRDRVLDNAWWEPGSAGEGASTPAKAATTWMGKRAKYEALFHNDVSWRAAVLGGIFLDSNLVVPLARRICRQMIARAQNYFFSTDPWFSAEPEGIEDEKLAEKIDRHVKWKLRVLGSKRNKERAVAGAFVRGETVVKTTHQVRDAVFEVNAEILVDVEDQPVFAEDGDYIFKTDPFNDVTTEVEGGRKIESGAKVLGRDGRTQLPAAPIWKMQLIKRRQVLFEGPESEPVYYKDFLCPLTAKNVQEADCIVHLYDKPVMAFVDLYAKRGLLEATEPEQVAVVERAVELIRNLQHNSAQAKAGATQAPRPGEDSNSKTGAPLGESEPLVEVAEFCLWFDANGDGQYENIFLVVDKVNRLPIFYDYVANMTPDGERPYDVVRVGEVDGRWYGTGCMEMFETSQEIADLLVNRWNFSQSRSGRIDIWDPSKTLEGEADPRLALNWGGTYTARPGQDPKEILHSIYLTDVKSDVLKEMIEFFQQVAMNESGVMNSNDAAAAGLDTGKLATGIRNIEKSGQEIFAPFLSDLEPGLQSVLNREMLVLYANLDRRETFTYLNGDTAGIDTITPEEVKGLKLNVTLLLTRYKGEQTFQQMLQASQVVREFYSLPPLVQENTAAFYRAMLKALDAKIDADVIIAPLPVQVAPTGAVTPEGGAATKPLQPGKSPANL